jgi:hypothetical protein
MYSAIRRSSAVGSVKAVLEDRRIGTLYNIIDLADMHIFIIAAQTQGHVFIYFYNGYFTVKCQPAVMRVAQTEIETAVFVHRCDLSHPYIRP